RTPVFIGDVLNVFSEDARTHLRQLIGELARGLPDGGAQLRSAFAAVTPWLEAQATLTRTLAARRGITRRLVHNLRALLGELGSRDRAMASLVTRGASTLGEAGAQRAAVDRLLRELPPTLTQMDGSFARLRTTLDAVRPALSALRPTARALPEGLDALHAFAAPALPALRRLRPAIAALTPLARRLAPTSGALAG